MKVRRFFIKRANMNVAQVRKDNLVVKLNKSLFTKLFLKFHYTGLS